MLKWQFSSSAFARDGLTQFRKNPLRVGLSILGMIFGVGSLIAMNSIGAGAQKQIAQIIETIGVDLVHVVPKTITSERLVATVKHSTGLAYNDVFNLQRLFQGKSLFYQSSKQLGSYYLNNVKQNSQNNYVVGVSSGYLEAHHFELQAGRMFLPFDHHSLKRTVIVGEDFLPEGQQKLGQYLRLEGAYYTLVGILSNKKQNSELFGSVDTNSAAFIPIETYHQELEVPQLYNELNLISLKTSRLEDTILAKQQLLPYLNVLHGDQQDFSVIAPLEVLQQKAEAQGILNLVFGIIATISLIVGGIGIMNMMIASVTERTKEIGLRRALGATQKDIARLFLNEALFISFVGGGLGLFFGSLAGWVVDLGFGIPTGFSLVSNLIAFSTAALIGVIFGLYPAKKAAKLDPVEALYYG